MNRREFLLGLLSVPFGWKALFKKEDEEVINADEVLHEFNFGSNVEIDDIPDGWMRWKPLGDDWLRDGYVEINKDPYREFAGLDKVINTGREVGEWQVVEDMDGCECPECSGGLPLPDWVADGMRSGTYFEREVEIPLDDIPDGWMRWPPIDAPSENTDKDPYAYEWSEPACCPPGLPIYGKWAARPMYVRCGDGKVIYCPDVSVPDPQWFPSNVWPARDENLKIVWEPA